MKKLLKLKELKKLFLLLPILLLISCAVKVRTVTDEFYGTQYYQTDYMGISGWSYAINFSFIADKEITLSCSYKDANSYTISENNKIILKFSDNSLINLTYINDMPAVDRTVYTSSYSGKTYSLSSHTINAEAKVNNDIGILTAIRIENSKGYRNLDVKASFANKFQKAYNDIKNKINE